MEVTTYNFLKDNNLIYVKIDGKFRDEVKGKIIQEYEYLTKYCSQELDICYGALKKELNQNQYFKFNRLLKIAEDVGISEKEVFSHISAFFARGSNTTKEIILPQKLSIDETFVESYALYLGEGDTGLNGNTRPRKLRFTNSDLGVIKVFILWLRKYFPDVKFYLEAITPSHKNTPQDLVGKLRQRLNLKDERIKLRTGEYNEKMKYRVCCDSAIMIDLFLGLGELVKEKCRKGDNLARAYIRGLMIAEGTVYFKKSRYVRIEMASKKEIKYLYQLFQDLDYNCRISSRSDDSGRWGIYIGAKQLEKFKQEIGFGVHEARQKILEKAVNKKLSVNQYC